MGSILSAPTTLVVFPPRAKVTSLADFELYSKQADACNWLDSTHDELLITLSDAERGVISKLRQTGHVLADASDIQRGVTPFSLSKVPVRRSSREAFNGTVRRYTITMGDKAYIQYDESLAEYKAPRYFEGPRLLLRELISRQFRLQAVYTHEDFITNKSMQSILPMSEGPHILYLLGLLNSRLLSWFFLAVHSVGRRDDFPKIVLKQTRELPLPDFNPTIYRAHHDQMVGLVEGMLSLHGSLSSVKTADERNALQRQIDATDKEIDRLVYALYGLSDDEIRIVEDATR